ncbi:hypothetical protein M9Y10_000899 [Tritrichomonas musculus]|uniref:Uncharacterized protein n=1 Tax=Tritrichomonas musculus TaxID=1915356 RepID=A0ABR2L766_9EUKA
MQNVDFENKEEANLGSDEESSKNICKYVLCFLALFLVIFLIIFFILFNFSNFVDYFSDSDFDPIKDKDLFNDMNLTDKEYNDLSSKIMIVDNFLRKVSISKSFTPLFTEENKHSNKNPKDLIPLNKISFAISSCPKTAYMCKLYLDMWSTRFGSKLVEKTGIRPHTEVYWNLYDVYPTNNKTFFPNIKDYNTFKSYKITLINQSSHHRKWFYMIGENFKTAPSDVEWFVIADDDSLPFLDRLDEYLTEYKDPLNNPYFIHSPGERISGTHLGNAGSGFILSRKLAEIIVPQLDDCMKHIRRRFYNGDIRLDHCIRVWGKVMPVVDYGMFHLDPKSFKGDMTGFIEGYLDRYRFKGLHHLEKKFFNLFPTSFFDMMENNQLYNVNYIKKIPKKSQLNLDYDTFSNLSYFSPVAHFVNTSAISGDLFLKRYIIKLDDGKKILCGILNFGYSFVVFSKPLKKRTRPLRIEIQNYLKGVEKTFTPFYDIYENLTRLLIPKNEKLKRFYYLRSVKDSSGKNSYWQEYCSVSSPETVVKIHVDDDQNVALSFFNHSHV